MYKKTTIQVNFLNFEDDQRSLLLNWVSIRCLFAVFTLACGLHVKPAYQVAHSVVDQMLPLALLHLP